MREEIARLKKELDRSEKEMERLKQEGSYVKVAAQREGPLAFVGTDVKEGQILPSDPLITASVGNDTRKYHRLREGDHVEVGQLLGRVDDRLARDEMKTKEFKVDAAKADLVVSEKTRDEAKARLDTQIMLDKRKATSMEDLRTAKLGFEKYEAEVLVKKAAISVAEAELRQIQTVVQLHELRSPVRGVIKSILKHPGEGVKYLEPVIVIQPEEK